MRSTRFSLYCLILSTAALETNLAQTYSISTYAGGGPPPTPAAGVDISIGLPLGIASDQSGNAYFASLNCVFKVDRIGVVTRIAGNSRGGYSGDGGPAIAAQLLNPWGVTVDGIGNVYVADFGNFRIRRIGLDGIITTVAGNGTFGSSGDGGAAIDAQLSYPTGVAIDSSGNLFIAQSYFFSNIPPGANRIRKVSPDGLIQTVAGNGTYGFSGDGGPAVAAALSQNWSIAVDPAGNLFIADYFNNRVRKVSPDGIITSVIAKSTSDSRCIADSSGDGGPASRAHFCAPHTVAVDDSGNLFIGEYGFYDDGTDDRLPLNFIIRKVSPNGTISTLAGNGVSGFSGDGGPARAAELVGGPLAVDKTGALFLADSTRIREISPDGIIRTTAGNGYASFSGDGGPVASAMLDRPVAVTTDRAGNVFILDNPFYSRVRKVTPDGIINTVAGNGTQGYSGDGGPAIAAAFRQPQSLAVDAAGDLFIADVNNNRVRKVSPDGLITTIVGNGGASSRVDSGSAMDIAISPNAVAVDAAGDLFIADGLRIRKLTPDDFIQTVAGMFGSSGFSGDGGPATQAQLQYPRGIALDALGNLFIADGSRVRKVATDGVITTVAGNGEEGYSGDGGPATQAALVAVAVAVDDAGNLFILGNNRVRKVLPDGLITTIAGLGTPGYSGDGGPAAKAEIWAARSLALDQAGNIYIADTGNNAVRVLRPDNEGRQ
jgi:sugar lactone lactonase YvrE